LWRRSPARPQFTLRQLLPDRRELRLIGGLLASMYLILGLALRPEALPGISSPAFIWLIYAGLIALFIIHLRRSRQQPLPNTVQTAVFSWKKTITPAVTFTLTSTLGSLLLAGAGSAIILLIWLGGGGLGVYLLARSFRAALKTKDGRRLRPQTEQ